MPDALSVRVCRLCAHWCGLPDPSSGECRIRAPQLIAGASVGQEGEARRVFPLTSAADWCGQWQADPARVAADLEAQEAKARAAIRRLESKLKTTQRSLEMARGVNPAPPQSDEAAGGFIDESADETPTRAPAPETMRPDPPPTIG